MEKDIIKNFYDSAKRLCEFLSNTVIKQENIDELLLLLTDTYGKGLILPDVELDDNAPVKVPKPDPIIIEIPLTYWEIFDPFTKEAPVCGDLLDDLSDIREDLLEGICEYEAGFINNAVFEWKLLHRAHFGNHMVSAIKALQHLRSEH